MSEVESAQVEASLLQMVYYTHCTSNYFIILDLLL